MNEDRAFELLKIELEKINAEYLERNKEIRRFDLFMKWSFVLIVVSLILEPFVILFFRGFCN